MTTGLTIVRPTSSQPFSDAKGADAKVKKMTITPDGQANGLVVPYAPKMVTKQNIGMIWAEVSRVGQGPLLVPEGNSLPQLQFQLFLGHVDDDRSVKPLLNRLEQYAQSSTRLQLSYSSVEDGFWHINSMSYTTQQRRPDHEPTQATVEVTFVQSTGGFAGVGPVTGGVGNGKGKEDDGNVIMYTVVNGDTLHRIAIKFFKDASRWKDIAEWNDIKFPKKDLKVGRKLEIRQGKRTAHASTTRGD